MMNLQMMQLRHTVALSVLNMVQNTQAAQAAVMIEDMAKTQANLQQAPHPTLGKLVDVRA